MSSAYALAAVTIVLKDLLDNRLVRSGVAGSIGDVIVTALPPDRIPVGGEERNQLNLFLYRVTPHIGWRGGRPNGAEMPDREARQPSLTLDLHYLVTAYGEQDFLAEILLGHAVQLLHELPVLPPEAFRDALTTGVSVGARAALTDAALDEQAGEIKICPEFLSAEETSKLWSSLQARYRLSAAYKVSSVPIAAGG